MKTFKCRYYEVTCPDGGGIHSEVVAQFTNWSDAAAVADELTIQKNWPHYAYDAPKEMTISVFESAQEYRDSTDEEKIKKAALAKLTAKERSVLGL